MKELSASTTQTMSSLEIAKLTGKNHSDVIRDIRKILEEMGEGGISKFADTYRNAQNGQDYPCFKLPRRECDIIISGYSLPYRVKIIDRWQELETAAQKPIANPQIAAMIMALEAVDRVEQEQKRILATQDQQSQRLDSIEAKQSAQGDNYGFYSVLGYANLKKMRVTLPEASAIGKRARALSDSSGVQIGSVPDARFGKVNTYHESILAECF